MHIRLIRHDSEVKWRSTSQQLDKNSKDTRSFAAPLVNGMTGMDDYLGLMEKKVKIQKDLSNEHYLYR